MTAPRRSESETTCVDGVEFPIWVGPESVAAGRSRVASHTAAQQVEKDDATRNGHDVHRPIFPPEGTPTRPERTLNVSSGLW